MRDGFEVTRRSLLAGKVAPRHHISSAVIVVLPARRDEVRTRLAAMPGVEVHAGDGSRIVITIEGPSSGMLGETLTGISAIDGVISANMVFEHVEQQEDAGS
jgi:nitrate reductase NapD